MEFIFTERFKKSYKKLSKDEQKALHKKLSSMSRNTHHSSLRNKKVQGTNDIFECSVSVSIRMTWKYDGESIVLRVVGRHDEVLKNP
jgi:mRNA-degrading endonuclease YafQ of YafQ-DinJ toxin-antitoxin module